MIPDTGFLPTDDLAEPLQDIMLPVRYEARYSDSSRRGKPDQLRILALGDVSSELIDSATTRRFTAAIYQNGVYGAILLDTIY